MLRRHSIATQYTQILEFEAMLGMRSVRVRTKQGFANWDTVTPAAGLLADTAQVARDAQVLLLGCGHGALAAAMADQASQGEIWCMDTNFVALRMAEETLQVNGVENGYVHTGVTLLPAYAGSFDVVLMELPKGRALARRWLVEAFELLRLDGKLYLAGPNAMGIKSVIQDLEALFGSVVLPGYKKRNRIAVATKRVGQSSGPDWAGEAGIASGTWNDFTVEINDTLLHLYTLAGVFAADKLDAGTALLLSHLRVPANAHVLDVGCGCGVIGLYAAHAGAAAVDMVDANLLAVAAANENIRCQNFDANQTAVAALPSDALSGVADRRYDFVLTNPPFHAGKNVEYAAAHAFIEQARAVLNPGGKFLLVANKFIRYNELVAAQFGSVTTVAEDNRYHLLLAAT